MFLVSVIIPVFNHSRYLKKRIDSVLEQTYENFELILLDDASTDDSEIVMRSYVHDKRISFCFSSKTNSGSPFGLWEKGISLAKGDLIWIAESDDWADPFFLEKLVPMFSNKQVMVAHCRSNEVVSKDLAFTYKKNTWWDSFSSLLWEQNFVLPGRVLMSRYGRFKCPVVNVSSALIRKSALSGVDIPLQFSYAGDWWFWSQLFLKGDVAFCAESLNYFRLHANSATGAYNVSGLKRNVENIVIIKKINRLCGYSNIYSPYYKWVIDYWRKDFFKTTSAIQFLYTTFKYLPFSFQRRLYAQLVTYYFRKLFAI